MPDPSLDMIDDETSAEPTVEPSAEPAAETAAPSTPEDAVAQALKEHGDDPAAIVSWLKDSGYDVVPTESAGIELGGEEPGIEEPAGEDEGMDIDVMRLDGVRNAMKKHGYDTDEGADDE